MLPIVAEQLAGPRPVLDVGRGEGQVARHLLGSRRRTGHRRRPVGQPARASRGARAGGAQLRAGPRPTRCRSRTPRSTAVVACLVFEHIAEVDAALAEVARVLAPGGMFLFLLNHPLLQVPGSGWIDDQILEEQYWRIGPYLVESLEQEEIAPGVMLPFVHRPLSRYVNPLAEVGLLIERMDEPAPPPGFPRPGASSTPSR